MHWVKNMSEKEQIENYRRLFEAKRELHKLMRRVLVSIKLGRQHKQPDDDIEMDIGNGTLASCARYEQVRYFLKGALGEYEMDRDVESIEYLIKEIKNRFRAFQAARDSNKLGFIQGKRKFAQKYFEKPLEIFEKTKGDDLS